MPLSAGSPRTGRSGLRAPRNPTASSEWRGSLPPYFKKRLLTVGDLISEPCLLLLE